jgi:hypothetical protein
MTRQFFTASMLPLLIGCAAASSGMVTSGAAGPDSFECVRDLLSARGYDVRRADPAAQQVEAEVRRPRGPTGSIREIIIATVEPRPGATPALNVRVHAFEYFAAEHGLPINRQNVHEIRPSGPVAADADELLSSCGVHEPERLQRVRTAS